MYICACIYIYIYIYNIYIERERERSMLIHGPYKGLFQGCLCLFTVPISVCLRVPRSAFSWLYRTILFLVVLDVAKMSSGSCGLGVFGCLELYGLRPYKTSCYVGYSIPKP